MRGALWLARTGEVNLGGSYMLTITPAAIGKLKSVLAEEKQEPSLRILVMPGGHGLQYMLTPETTAKDEDLVEDLEGLKVILDTDSAVLLEGAEIDYVEEFPRAGFVITNPNAQAFGGGCGCGGGGCGCGGAEQAEGEAQTGACACGGAGCGGHGEGGHSH
jgi:iron-sulfur cluster insertion protein